MCKCYRAEQKLFRVLGCGDLIMLVGLILGLLCPTLALSSPSTVDVEQKSLNLENWIEKPIPMYMEITMFNWTNSNEVYYPNVKPFLTEMGPYVFLEHYKRTNITWNRNGTITFNQIRTWSFMPDMSNGSLDDEITNLNVVSAGAAFSIRKESSLVKFGFNILINTNGGSLFVTKKVGELLFDGYQDDLLDYLIARNLTIINIPFEKFGWLVERNGSWSHDGEFNMNTGKINITEMGTLHFWNGKSTTGFYSDGCSKINGTTGKLWPPNLNTEEDITIFLTDICRSISLAPEDYRNETFGIQGSKWIGDERVFDNGENYSPNTCFCTGSEWECHDLKSGVLNVSDCHFGLPIFMSYPHFYLADPSFANSVDGLNATRENHEFSITLEPQTGIPLELNARLQMNILLQPISGLSLYQYVPHAMIPMFWFSHTNRHVSREKKNG